MWQFVTRFMRVMQFLSTGFRHPPILASPYCECFRHVMRFSYDHQFEIFRQHKGRPADRFENKK
jgi:hypothetical protein